MKQRIIFIALSLCSLCVFGTEQAPDKLLYGNLTLRLQTGWGHPSPLETYFHQNHIVYPFSMISTGNYRGHVATWLIDNGKFYLKEIAIRDKTYTPDKYKVKSKSSSDNDSNAVFADWFSGIIECNKTDEKDRWKTISTYYFHIRNGEIISMDELTKKDFERINNISEKDTADHDLISKYKLLLLNQNYITYYYRLNANDGIEYQGRKCQLNTGTSRLSPLYKLYSDEHLNWPYNWENLEKSGAPNCNWIIVNDSLKLANVSLHSGLRFDSADKEILDLAILLPDKVGEGPVFADWVTGIQIIIIGIDTSYGFGLKEFKPKEYTYCRFEKGILKEAFSIPAGIKENTENIDPRLKKMIEEYNN